MRQLGRRAGLVPMLALIAAMLAAAPAASAHVTKVSGPMQVEIGWGNEPPLTGLDNFVEVTVSDAATDAPVAVPAGALSVAVSYGGTAKTIPLTPDEAPGNLRAPLIPTRPGVYAFHVSGVIKGRTLDVSATCSEATFECVTDSSSVEFPAKDPTSGELAERIAREADRAQQASDDADSAKTFALVALAFAAAALAGALAAVRRRRKSGQP